MWVRAYVRRTLDRAYSSNSPSHHLLVMRPEVDDVAAGVRRLTVSSKLKRNAMSKSETEVRVHPEFDSWWC